MLFPTMAMKLGPAGRHIPMERRSGVDVTVAAAGLHCPAARRRFSE
jgi:hypothetical protein